MGCGERGDSHHECAICYYVILSFLRKRYLIKWPVHVKGKNLSSRLCILYVKVWISSASVKSNSGRRSHTFYLSRTNKAKILLKSFSEIKKGSGRKWNEGQMFPNYVVAENKIKGHLYIHKQKLSCKCHFWSSEKPMILYPLFFSIYP